MERDDIIEYSLDTHHSEEQGKKIRRKIMLVTAILTVITAFEVGVGMTVHQDSSSQPRHHPCECGHGENFSMK